MFSALNQGSLVHILDKTDGLHYTTGEVIGFTQPIGAPSFGVMTLKLRVNGEVKDYPNIPSNQSVASYNNGNFIISETKQGIQNEVENFVQSRKFHIENIDKYKSDIQDGEAILKQINPQFAKDKERDDRINGLEDKVGNIGEKVDLILKALYQNNSQNIQTNKN